MIVISSTMKVGVLKMIRGRVVDIRRQATVSSAPVVGVERDTVSSLLVAVDKDRATISSFHGGTSDSGLSLVRTLSLMVRALSFGVVVAPIHPSSVKGFATSPLPSSVESFDTSFWWKEAAYPPCCGRS
ncbi:unnamed protein product [Linum trigynum]|uniref:Uncharacterized protein n=1 Tax=Linum trigynum TaxID=586398 RepID=A0AAV2CGN0_9ROSI